MAPRKPILVVRQEHLQNDMNALEAYLGGNPNNNKWHTSDSVHFVTGRVSSAISKKAARVLCCYLQIEIQIYQAIIARAENFSTKEKSETFKKALQICGVQSAWDELSCPDIGQ